MEYVTFRFPSVKDASKVSKIYKEAYKEAEELGLYKETQVISILRREKIFTTEMEEELKDLIASPFGKYPFVEELDGDEIFVAPFLEDVFAEIVTGERTFFFKDAHDILKDKEEKKYIAQSTRFKTLIETKVTYTKMSCEKIAETKKKMYLLYLMAYKEDTNERFWGSFEDLLACKSQTLVIVLMGACVSFLNGFSPTIMRRLSKHSSWRTKWVSGIKTGQNLFDGNISEWDINKTFLAYWSNFYDNIYESPERPEDYVIADDELLDNYLDQKNTERERARSVETSSDDSNTNVARFRARVNPIKKR